MSVPDFPPNINLPPHVERILRNAPEELSAIAFDIRHTVDAISSERPDKIDLEELLADARTLEALVSQLTGVFLAHDFPPKTKEG